MTKQMHKYVRECEQLRKECRNTILGFRMTFHTRNWWKAWHRRYKKEQQSE